MTETIARLHSAETEQAYLGCVLIDGDVLTHSPASPEDFQTLRNRWIYEAADTVRRRGDPVDFLTVMTEMERSGKINESGGPAYLMSLINATPSSLNAEAYVAILREKRRRRDLVTIAQRIVASAYDETKPVESDLPSFITDLAASASCPGGAQPIGSVLSALYDEVSARMTDPRDVWGIPTKFTRFDLLTGGLQEGEVALIAGLPGTGKSILGNDIAAGMAQTAPGAVYSMEMKSIAVARRLISGRSGVATRALKTGRISEEDLDRFIAAVNYFSSLPISISDSQGWTTTSLRADLARLKVERGIRWVLLDYMYLLKDGEGKDENTRTLMQAEGLKRIASELDLAVLVIHSLNKSGMGAISGSSKNTIDKDDMVGLQNLRGSAQVAYTVDTACYLTGYNPDWFSSPADKIAPAHRKNARVLWFGKGRELEDPNKYVIFIQRPGFPVFGEYAPEPVRSPLPRPREANMPLAE